MSTRLYTMCSVVLLNSSRCTPASKHSSSGTRPSSTPDSYHTTKVKNYIVHEWHLISRMERAIIIASSSAAAYLLISSGGIINRSSGSLFREMERSAAATTIMANSSSSNAARWPTLTPETRPALSTNLTWFRSLAGTNHHHRTSSRLPKLPGSHQSDDVQTSSCNKESNSVYQKLSRIVLPPLRTSSPCYNHSSLGSSGSSWLLPTVQRKELYRQGISTVIGEMVGCQISRHQAAVAPSSSSSSSAGKVGRLPPLEVLPCPLNYLEGLTPDEEEGAEEAAWLAAASVRDGNEQLFHIGEFQDEQEHYLDDVFREQRQPEMEGAALSGHGCPQQQQQQQQQQLKDNAESCSFEEGDGAAGSLSWQPTCKALQWTIDWAERKEDLRHIQSYSSLVLPNKPAEKSGLLQHQSTVEDFSEVDDIMATSYEWSRPNWTSNSSSAGKVRHSPPPTSCGSPAALILNNHPEQRQQTTFFLGRLRAQTAHPSLSVDVDDVDEVIEEIDDHNVLDDELDLVADSTADEEDAGDPDSSISTYRLEKNEDGSEMPGYELPNYGSKPIALDADDEHYGVTMEQLKKLLRPSSNNNEEDEESKEDMNIVNRITTSVPAYRRPVTEKLVSTPRHYAILPNAVHDPVSEDEEEEEVKHFEEEEDLIFKNSSNGFHNYYDDDRPLDVNIRRKNSQEEEELLRIGGIKSNSVAAFASSNSTSPKEDLASTARHRSLPARRNDSARTDLKSPSESRYLSNNSSRRTALGVMPSSVMNRRLPAAASNNSTLTSASGGGPSSHSLSQSRVSSNNKFSTATPGQNGTTGRNSTNGIPVDFQHSQDPRNRLQSALKNINSSDWEDKVEGIRKLDELVSTNAESVASDVHTVALALLVEVKNLRSQVSRVAIQSMGNLFQYCGRYLDQDLERAVRLLLNRAGDTNRFIRDDAHVALMAVTQYISPPRAIVAITAEGLSHKNAAVRAEAAKLLAAIVERLGPNRSLSGAKDVTERLLPAAAVFIQDGNLEARAQAKRMFSVLMQDPVFDRAVQKYLTTSVIRNIQRTLDQLRKNI